MIVASMLVLVLAAMTSWAANPDHSTADAGGPSPEPELEVLEEAMEAAATQTEMDRASSALAKYWERQLGGVEEQIAAAAPDEDARQMFRAAQTTWRAWREAEIAFRGDTVRGGTARPTVESLAMAALTEERVKNLTATRLTEDRVQALRRKQKLSDASQ